MRNGRITGLYVVTRLVIAILVLFFLTVIARVFTRQILEEALGMNNNFTRIVFFDKPGFEKAFAVKEINWEKEYPFSERKTTKTNPEIGISKTDIFERIRSLANTIENKVINYTTNYVIFYSRFSEMANLYRKTIGWNLVPPEKYNEVISLENGFLTTVVEERNVVGNVSAMAELKDFLEPKGIDLLFVQIPHKICREDKSLSGVIDFSNQNADALLSGLAEHKVEFVDLRQSLHREELHHRELFFKTDAHWKAETGLWAAGVLSEHLNNHYGFAIDLEKVNPANYEFQVYGDWLFGSQGKKVTLSRAEPEDISLIYPKFEVDLSVRIPNRNIDKRGTFDIVYDYDQIEARDYYNSNPYLVYMYENNAYSSLVNNLIREGDKVLIIGDSFDNTIIPFLSLGIQRIDSLDLRLFNGSLHNLIEKNEYSLVIINYCPDYIGDIANFSLRNPFDFI